MILSTQTEGVSKKYGDEKAVRLISGAGFDAVDYSMFFMQSDECVLNTPGYENYALNLRQIAEDCGVFFNQAHAPFPSYREGDDTYNEKITPKIIRAMEVASILGVKIIVVHPTDFKEDKFLRNIEFYNNLLPYCKQYNIRVALENMWGRDAKRGYIISNVCSEPEEFARYLDALDDTYFTGCLDLGHCGLVGVECADAIKTLGHKRLRALHVHDNDFKSDTHTLPFFSKMDWEPIAAALKAINYAGDFTFEADEFLAGVPEDLLPSAYKLMHDVGRYLISRCE
jgi:L-ribulose-5-phosphate 3-epimerase